MSVNIGDNNRINKTIIDSNISGDSKGKIVKDIVVGIIVTVIGGVILAVALGIMGLK